jgi:hypothetical protein
LKASAARRAFINLKDLKHALKLSDSTRFSIVILTKRLTFCQQQQKVSKKCRSPNYVHHPIISDI